MEYIYFKSKKGNFGDDLNGWLWPQIFTENKVKPNDSIFLGIGSILFNENNLFNTFKNCKKIVFGTGIRPTYTNHFSVDQSWDIKFLRGPLSAQILNNKYPFIADSAYAVRLLPDFKKYQQAEKKYKISLMPYFHSVEFVDWKSICDQLGYHYISPFSEHGVEHTLQEIAASEHIITEAMHGAIVADLFRVPWHKFILTTPYTEGAMVSEFKWMDWAQSVEIPYFLPSSIKFLYGNKSSLNSFIKNATGKIVNVQFYLKDRVNNDLLNKLGNVTDYYLSTDSVISTIDAKLNDQTVALIKELKALS